MSLGQLLLILRARRWLIASIVGGGLLMAIALWLVLPKVYTASTSVMVDFESREALAPNDARVPLAPGYMETQLDIIASHAVALHVADRLKLVELPEVKQKFMRSTDGKGSIRDWVAENLLLDHLKVKPGRHSRVIHISYSAREPRLAAMVADAFAQAYVEMHLDLDIEPARRNTAWLEEQLKPLRQKAEEAQAKLTAYQQKNQVAGEDRLDTEMQRLASLNTALATVQTQVYDARARGLGENHPEVQRVRGREQELEQAVAAQKRKLLQTKKQRDQVAMLQREAENAESTYDKALARHNQVFLESRADQTNITVLNRAVEPNEASFPKLSMNLAVALVLGPLLGIFAALVREMTDRRVRVVTDLTEVLGVPFLAVLERARA